MTTSNLPADFVVSLPAEVLLTIFGAQDSFRDMSALFRTCKSLYALWQTRASSISKPLLVRQTPCYKEVEALIVANEAAELTVKPKNSVVLVDSILGDKLGNALNRISLSRQIVGQARYLCDIIESRYLQQKYNCHDAKCRARPSTLPQHERDDVTRAHHFIKLYMLTYANQGLADLHEDCKTKLEAMSDANKHFLFQLTKIMHDYALPWDKMRLDLCSYSLSPVLKSADSPNSVTWADKFKALQEVTRVQVTSCGDCIYDDTARFSRIGQ
ncbi:hypothetical protein KCU81_g7399, partial [Aureobasidium melanogenum]|uniref:F-box domain-containing protein n=1 Tax=Aureobasidium melanogenum (strain CBS 110374) TaxID=1043003 RepID=A0A074VZD9_AURM1